MMSSIRGKHVELSIEQPEALYRMAHALASEVRIRIIRALGERSMSVGELAQALGIPMSSAALAVKILEEADLIMTETQPGTRGSMKICSRKTDTMAVSLMLEEAVDSNVLTLQMPIGGYSFAENIRTTCGIVGEHTHICEMDDPSGFYVPGRFGAQLIWFRQGALEYRFSYHQMDKMEIEWLELSFEACSEAPMHRDPWKSDIEVSINGRALGRWVCPCDCGGRRGRLTPAKIKEYLLRQYGSHGEEMWNKLIIGEYDMTDRSLDSLAVRASRKFDPGYNEKREREIAELIEKRALSEKIEQELEAEYENYAEDFESETIDKE